MRICKFGNIVTKMNEDNKRSVIFINLGLNFFLKSWRMRIWYASIFLSLLAGKFCPFEQSAGVTQVMEIFKHNKMR